MRRAALSVLLLLSCTDDPVRPGQPARSLGADADLIGADYTLFEAGPVRPLARTPSGDRLIVANVPDDRIEVFLVDAGGGLVFEKSIAVGLRPVAVAARTDDEVWVVNHLSDSVSVVDLEAGVVTRTLLVGDEPRDVVFAGVGAERAFVTTAHRGQHRTHASLSNVPGAGDPQLTTAGVGRADVWVFDPANLTNALGGRPVRIVTLFGDTARGLAVSPDRRTVYASILHSGNQTTVVPEGRVCNGFDAAGPCAGDGVRSPNGLPRGRMPGGLPGPSRNIEGRRAPETALIVKFDGVDQRWEDALGRNWSNGVRFFLPDIDVFALDAATLAITGRATGVGTTIFNLATNAVTGRIYASNTDAQNLVRFEGAGDLGGSSVQGDLARARITVVDPGTFAARPVDLNSHLDRTVRPAPPGAEDSSLSTPLEVVVSADGATLYVAGFGSGVVGVIPTAALEGGTFDPERASADYVPVTGGGPAGLVLDDARDLLYVYTRFDDGVSVVDTSTGAELDHVLLASPEPDFVVAGRPVLYDAKATSSNGEASCASCHVFADLDAIAWDLGNPEGVVTRRLGVVHFENGASAGVNGSGDPRDMHPMKGPMLTQTLRGIGTHGPMHWRGDRMIGLLGTDALDERTSFLNFVVAFQDLLGDDVPPDDPQRIEQIELFADFALSLSMPPNPVRAIDNSLTASQARGRALYVGPRRMDGRTAQFDLPGQPAGFTCEGCHRLDPASGFFGADGAASLDPIRQVVKVPQFRNAYARVGMFGNPNVPFVRSGNNQHRGNQVSGYGFMHDGSVDTLFRLVSATAFAANSGVGFQSDAERRDVEQFLLAYDSDLAPVVGQQVTVHPSSGNVARDRARLLAARAGTPFTSATLGGTVRECDLVVHQRVGDRQVGMLFDPATQRFTTDTSTLPTPTIDAIFTRVTGQQAPATFTCVPPGTGVRSALDRDRDGVLDGDEVVAGTDPATPDAAPRTAPSVEPVDSDVAPAPDTFRAP